MLISHFIPEFTKTGLYPGLTGYQSSCMRGLRELRLARNEISTLTSIQLQQLPGRQYNFRYISIEIQDDG